MLQIGDLKRSRFDDIDILYIAGANDGLLPSAVTGGGLFTDREREEMERAELELAPDDKTDSCIQLFYLYMIMNKAEANALIRRNPVALAEKMKSAKPTQEKDSFPEEEVKALIGKTNLIPDETMEDRARGIRGTRVEVVSRNGQTVAETVLVPKGDPENPLTRDDIVNKLRVCAQGQSSENNLMKLVQSIERIEGDSVFENPMKIIGAME